MPITQERMMALIDAGLDYQQATKQACQYISEAIRNAYAGADPIKELDDLAILIVEGGLLKYPTESPVILQIERRHFKKFSSRNKKRRDELRSMRATKQTNPRSTAPETFEDLRSVRKEKSRSEQIREAINSGRAPQFHFRGLDPAVIEQIEAESAQEAILQKKQEEFMRENAGTKLNPNTGQLEHNERTSVELEEELDDLLSGGIKGDSKGEG